MNLTSLPTFCPGIAPTSPLSIDATLAWLILTVPLALGLLAALGTAVRALLRENGTARGRGRASNRTQSPPNRRTAALRAS